MCLFPLKARKDEFGQIEFTNEGDLRLPCGKCTECISKRSIEWATRAKHEISCHKENCFLTLTYDEESLPSVFTVKTEFQKFIKRLRKKTKKKLRYMVSHEYGSTTFRPHHHCIIFGYTPSDQVPLKRSSKGEQMFVSEEISALWGNGYHSIGAANERTAYYIASYSLKGKKHMITDPKTGEIVLCCDTMDVSKRPAIGLNFLVDNAQQLIDCGKPIPRYYFKKLEKLNPTLHQRYEEERMFKFKDRDCYELYAKFLIDESKKLDSEFRKFDSEPNAENEYLKEDLKTKRDDYHHKYKRSNE